jgi:uncharacterized repeat protein (TIGR02543 family)
MKKLILGITAIVISFVFISCPDDSGNDDPDIPVNPDEKTVIVFDNTYGICTVMVYDDYRRRETDKIVEIPAGRSSDEIECMPSASTPFYFAYRISLRGISGFAVDFVPEVGKDQKAVRIDAGKKTVIPIPVLDDAVSNQQQVLSPKSYLTVQNNSAYSFQLYHGVSMIRPDNSPDSGVVNSYERAPYTISPGRSSDYRLLVGADYKAFPDTPERFEAGNFYSYQYNNSVSLDTQIPINLDNMNMPTYSVSFSANGGSGTVPAAQIARASSGITLPLGSGLANGDKVFGGWGADAAGSGIVYSAGTTYTVTRDIILYAKWYPAGALYTVTFNSAGGKATASQSMASGALAVRPPDPYRAGYTFTGWCSDAGGQNSYDFETPVTKSFTLYAAWDANKYTVTFNANGADGEAPSAVTVDHGSVITLPTAGDMSKPDGPFLGWNTEDDGTGTAYASGAQYPVTADVTLFAVWDSAVNAETPVISVQPISGTYPLNAPASPLTVQAGVSDGGTLSYQWYRNSENSSSGGTLISGAASSSYTPPTNAAGTVYYYAVVTNTNNSVNGNKTATAVSDVAAVMVTEVVNAETPVISVQPISGTYPLNAPASPLTVQAGVSDGGTLSYQWYRNTDNSSSGGTLISGAVSSSDTPPTDTAGTVYYYMIVTNTISGVTAQAVSNASAVVVTVVEPPTINIVIPEGGSLISINTQSDLEAVRAHIDDPAYNNGKNAYVLEQDITLTGTWTPIGRVESVDSGGRPTGGIHAFSGNFYGNGHTIRNLVLSGGTIHHIGLFGYIENALIQDLQVELGENVISVTNSSAQYIGIIAGVHKNSVIRNCGVYSQSGITVNGTGTYHLDVAGISFAIAPLAGNIPSIIENCYVSMNIAVTNGGTHIKVCGITSTANIIRNCYYIGNITGTGQYAELFGISFEADVVEKSYSAGTITNNASSSSYTCTAGIGRDNSMSNCVTLMERIDHVNGTNYARIQPVNFSATLSNNYAYSGMLVNGATVSSNDPNSQNGLDKTAAQLKQRSTYEDGLGWDFDDVWEMGPSSYPFPILKWQNGVVKLPPGFTVIGSGETFIVSNVSEFNSALSTIRSSSGNDFTVTVTADLSLGPQDLTLAAYRNKSITLRGNAASRTISLSGQGSLFTVGADAELVLEDIVLVGISNNNTSLIKVNTDGTLVLNGGGKVTGNTYNTSVTVTGGGGIYVDGGTLEIAGGEISGNTVNGTARVVRGGGVYAVNGSNVLMTAGSIRNNSITNVHSGDGNAEGGGIALYANSRFEMTDGVIEGNALNYRSTSLGTVASGGGVNIYGNSYFYLRGGKIRNNTCYGQSASGYGGARGGGVSKGWEGGYFFMEGGVISGNSCTTSINPNKTYGTGGMYADGAYGGGVSFDTIGGGSFVKTGGIIYGNEVTGNDADGIPLKNTAQSDSSGLGGGYAVFYDNELAYTQKLRRNTTAYENQNMDGSVSGSAGGWE